MHRAMEVAMAEYEAAYEEAATCKHEWRQYLHAIDAARILDVLGVAGGAGMHDLTLIPDGFFCIHCMERSDG